MVSRLLICVQIIILILLLSSCVNGRKRDIDRQNSHSNTIKKPHKKQDTIYMVVPEAPQMTPENNDGGLIVPPSKKLKSVVHSDNLPTPPEIDFNKAISRYTRNEYIDHHGISGDMRDLIIACDYDNPTVRNNSVALVALSPGNFNLGQICDIFDFCYSNWSYVNDPVTKDYYAKSSETLRNGLNGDCDDFAILLCSMILSIGGEARISFAYDATSGHAFAEVNIGKTNRNQVDQYLTIRYGNTEMWHKEDSDGNWWLNLDWQGQYPGAKYWKYNSGTCFNIIRNEKYNL